MAKKKGKGEKKKKEGGGGLTGRLLLIFFIVVCVVFRATALLICVGMLPTVVAFLMTPARYQAKAYAVAALNFAGCTPYIFKLWGSSNDFEMVVEILTQPLTIVVMFGAAMGGYLLNWVCVAFVSSFMYEKAKMRMKTIEKRKENLVERWGEEVTGEIPLDPEGFPRETSKAALRQKI